jgi:hypothetical protein
MKQRYIRPTLAALLFCLGSNLLAAPIVIDLNPGYTLQAYSGAAPVNLGRIDVDSTLFYIREAAVGGLQSWYLFFDPASHGQDVLATLRFDAGIVDVLVGSASLLAAQTTFAVDVDGDGVFDDYGVSKLMGLEGNDVVHWIAGSPLLSIDWNAADPGDHIRVLVNAVPEPASGALAALALLAAIGIGRRKGTAAGA